MTKALIIKPLELAKRLGMSKTSLSFAGCYQSQRALETEYTDVESTVLQSPDSVGEVP